MQPYSAYRDASPVEKQGAYPGDLAVEERLTSIIRWNALALMVRANPADSELGGHIASYASAGEIFEVGCNHCFVRVPWIRVATWCSISRIRQRAFAPARFSRDASARNPWPATARKWVDRASAPVRTRG